MIYFLRFAYPWVLYGLLPLVVLLMWFRDRVHKQVVYRYSLGTLLHNHNMSSSHPHKKIFFLTRSLVLLILAFLIAKPQLVDSRSKVPVEGIDIVLVMDVSGSMQFQDYEDDNRSRFDVAKAEAIRFLQKRENDALGLVLFGKDAISRCPLTFDKTMLKDVVDELEIGTIDPDGTMLITAMVVAANRLKHSKAKSRVMIVLTDGEPSEGDMDSSVAIEIAKKLGIKIYTIGIGSEEEQLLMHPLYGVIAKPKVNKELLTQVAHATGGQYFMAHQARDMRRIYDTIDQLEKTKQEVPVFGTFYDVFIPFVFLLMGMILFELVLSSFVWFAL